MSQPILKKDKHIPRDFHLQNYIFLRLPTHSSGYFVYLHCSGII